MARRTRAQREQFAVDALEYMAKANEDLDLDGETIAAMDFDEILSVLQSNGVNLDLEQLEADARQTIGAKYLLAMDRGNLSPEMEQEIGARIEKAVTRSAEITARRMMATLREEAMVAGDDREWDQQTYVWISVGEGSCPDCHFLHGTVMAMDLWEENGTPGAGTTFCGEFCRCRLFPVDVSREEEGQRLESMRTDIGPRPG